MASKSLGTLTIDLVAKVSGFTQGMDKAERASAKWRRQIEKDAKAAGIAMGAAGAAAAAGLGYMIKASIDAADAASKAAQSTGLTTEAYTSLAFAADMSGVSTGELDAAMSRLNRTALEVAAGSEKQAALFKTLGVSVKDAGGALRDGDQILMDLADRFANMPDGIGKSSLAMEVFGKSGAKMIPLLNSGSEGIKDLTEQARALGLVINDEQAKSAERFNDNLSILAGVSRGAGNVIAGELLPVMNDFTAEMVDIAIKGELAASVGDTLATSLKALAATGVGVYASFQLAGKGIAGLAALQDQATQDGAWYEKFMPPVAAYRLYKNWQGVKDTAGVVMSDLDTTAQEFADILDRIWEAGKGGESGTSTEERLSKLKTFLADFSSQTDEGARAARKSTDAIESQIKALQLQADTVAMTSDQATLYKLRLEGATEAQIAQAEAALSAVSAYKEQAKAIKDLNDAQEQTNKEAVSIIDSLRTEEEAIRDSYERRRQIIMDATLLTAEERNEALLRLEQEHNEQMLQVNGSYWERYLAAAEENLQNFDELSGVMLENFTGRFGDAFESMVFDAESLGDAVHGLAEGMARSVINALGQMAAQWLAYQAVQLIVGKTTQASAASTMTFNALASQQMAAINAFASTAAIPIVGPVMAPAAATAAIAATSPMVGAVASLSLAGMAHDGIDAIPETGTWLLEKGERVTTAETSAKLDKTLSDIQQGGAGGAVNVNFIEDAAKAGTVETRREPDGTLTVDGFISNIMGDGKLHQAISRKYGLSGVGQ